jgi:hypothetical protein
MGQKRELKMSFRLGLFVTSLEKDYNRTPASYWIRILQMMDYYREAGAEVSLNKYFKKYDAVIVFRKAKRKYYYIMRFLSFFSKSVYFDTCINIFSVHEEIDQERLKYAKLIAKSVNGIICASSRIAEHARPYAKSVYVMEDPVDLNHFRLIKEKVNFDSPVFGWSGVGLKSVYLNRFASEISSRILLISEPGIKQAELKFEYKYIQWNYEGFPRDILNIDIALLPRDYNDPYNDSHSSFKALVFAIHGIPIIANKVPSYVDLSGYYEGIVFLEDHENDLQKCINELKTRNLDPSGSRNYYSCMNQATGLIAYLKKGIGK